MANISVTVETFVFTAIVIYCQFKNAPRRFTLVSHRIYAGSHMIIVFPTAIEGNWNDLTQFHHQGDGLSHIQVANQNMLNNIVLLSASRHRFISLSSQMG